MPDIETNYTPTVEIGGGDTSTAASFDNTGKATDLTTEVQDTTVFDSGNPAPELDIEDGLEETEEKASETGEEEQETSEDDSEVTNELPDFDPENEEVLKAYDAKYTSEDGTLNLDAFNAEMQAIYDKTGKADITPQARAYVKSEFGVSDKAIDTHLAGLEAQAQLADQKFYEAAGGKEAYESMLQWARAEGGYSEAQRERFNKAIKAGGDDLAEQLELLKTRFQAAGGKSSEPSPRARFRERRRASPEKVASGAAGGASAVQGFKDEAEFRQAQKAAGDDNAKHAEVRKRLTASSWFKAQRG